jgi:hypothetical protein
MYMSNPRGPARSDSQRAVWQLATLANYPHDNRTLKTDEGYTGRP